MTKDTGDEYRHLRPEYERFACRLADLLRDLLAAEGVRIHTVEHRAKTVESFLQKISRPEKAYRNPLRDVSDLAGVRIIAYYVSDIATIAQLVAREFAVDRPRSADRGASLKPNEFGYRSHHYVITLRANRRRLREWSTFGNFAAEIQVRTVVQHAWAAISHALQYKNETDVPVELARKLFRVSGLLELADEEFAEIYRRSAAIALNVAESLRQGNLAIPISRDALEQYVESSDVVQKLVRVARKAGFAWEDEFDAPPGDPDDSYAQLAWACIRAGVRTIGDLEQTTRHSFDDAVKYLNVLRSRSDTDWSGSAPWFLQLVVMMSNIERFDAALLVAHGWDEGIAVRVVNTAKELAA